MDEKTDGPLAGKAAVVTGGGRGIGAACARALAAAGARVLLASRTREEIERQAEAMRADGCAAHAHPCDVTSPDSVRDLLRASEAALGAVDILVNNAGIAHSAPLRAITIEDWNRLFAVNATGTFLCTQAFAPGMLARGWGRIVNVASIAARTGAPYIAAYAASKHAVLGFTRAVAAEVAATGVTINAVCPGYVETELTDDAVRRIVEKTGMSREDALARLAAQSPQKRIFQPDEVAFLVVSLCDPRARGVNGQAVVLDGGGLLS